jgi:N-acetyl-D-muramate 6-phosphate phosphatase
VVYRRPQLCGALTFSVSTKGEFPATGSRSVERILADVVPSHSTIRAIIWDYDGTLVDTRQKNFNVTRKIVGKTAGVEPGTFPVLQVLETYTTAARRSTNWRELYTRELGFTHEKTDEAGKLWTEFQLNDDTPTPLYDGIRELICSLGQFPSGIVSQNSRSNITRVLEKNGLLSYFRCIVGYEEVDLRKQKPEPDGLLLCIERLTSLHPGHVLYIGDHETDIQCARNANDVLQGNNAGFKVVSVGAAYSRYDGAGKWGVAPDYSAKSVRDVLEIVHGFEEPA